MATRLPLPPLPTRIPEFVAKLGRHLPQRPWSDGLTLALEAARFSKVLPSDIALLEGKIVRIIIDDMGAQASVRMRNGSFRPASVRDEADVSFRACAADYLKLLRREEDPDTLFFQRKLRIEGDTELGLMLKNLLDGVELPNWVQKLTGIFR